MKRLLTSKGGRSRIPVPSDDLRDQVCRSVMPLPGVVGVGWGVQGTRPCITVFVEKRTRKLVRKLPSVIDGCPVEIEVTGTFVALGAE